MTDSPSKSKTTAAGEFSPTEADRALAAELAADPAILAGLAEWERTSGPPARENSPAWDGRGVPSHASGYHWVRRRDVPGHDMPPVIWTWRADAQVWRWGHREMAPAEMAEHFEWMGRVVKYAPADPIDWKRVARALLDSANTAQDGDGYQVAAEVRATWVHYVGDANAER